MRVSVCIPVRNGARYVGEAIRSALAQDVDGLEVLVHDDASTDATAAAVAAAGDARVRYLRHDRPLGVARNRDSLAAAARAPIIAWLDGDDALLPGTLAPRVALLEREPRIALAHGAFEVVDADGRRLPDWPAPFEQDTVEPAAAAFANLLAGNELATSTVLVRRSCHVAGLAPRASSTDWALWLRAALRGDVAYSARPVARYRRHAGSISQATTGSGERLACDVAVVGDLLSGDERLPDRRAAARIARAALAVRALAHAGDLVTRGDRRASLRAVARAMRLDTFALGALGPRLLARTARGDLYGCYRTNRALLARLAGRLDGTRHGERLRVASTSDPQWEAALARAAATLRRVVPPKACVGAVTKWDPTLLALSGRRGRNFPDRRVLPDGYPRDGAAAVAHLDALHRDGLTHLALPSASAWWLEHYPELARRLGEPVHRDADLAVFDLR